MNRLNLLKIKYPGLKTFSFLIFAVFIIQFLLSGCQSGNCTKIALSKGKGSEHYEQYSKWLKSVNPNIEYIDLYNIDRGKALQIIESCSGIVFTGGPDVAPGRYGRPDDSSRCEIDYLRDTLEFDLIKKSLELHLPILAICRGEQIMNIYEGGSLIVDIPSDYDTTIIHRCPDPKTCFHKIIIDTTTLLFHICKTNEGTVNTNHHQAVFKLADCFKASAYSMDGLIEAYEWKNDLGKPFFLAVQWHPERLDSLNPFSLSIAKRFLEAVEKHGSVYVKK